jgi:AraC-like DNA-binding protein
MAVVDHVVEFVENNYSGKISLRDVAQAVGYSPAYLTNMFRRKTGTPITAWIIRRRILAAAELLHEGDMTVAAACYTVGFSDLAHFGRQFVRHMGTTPGRFRASVATTGRRHG